MNGVMDRMWNLQPKFSGILSDCTGSDPMQPRIAVNPNNKSPILEGFSSTFLVKLVMIGFYTHGFTTLRFDQQELRVLKILKADLIVWVSIYWLMIIF